MVVELFGEPFDAAECQLFEFGRAIEALDVEGQQVGDCVCLAYMFFEYFIVENKEIDGLRSHLLALHHAL